MCGEKKNMQSVLELYGKTQRGIRDCYYKVLKYRNKTMVWKIKYPSNSYISIAFCGRGPTFEVSFTLESVIWKLEGKNKIKSWNLLYSDAILKTIRYFSYG